MTIKSNIVYGLICYAVGFTLGVGAMWYTTPTNVLEQPSIVSIAELPKVDIVDIPTNTMVELPKPKHKIPFYPKFYCEALKDVDKSLFRDNSILKMGWTKLQVDTLYKQCSASWRAGQSP